MSARSHATSVHEATAAPKLLVARPCGSVILFSVSKRIRTFVVALVLLTLPMQSMAAASMLVCRGDNHATWLASVIIGDQHGHPGVGALSVVHKHAAHAVNTHHSDTEDGVNLAAGTDQHHPASSCSSCSDCCCVSSLPSSGQPTLVAVVSAGAPISIIVQPVSGYVPERLDRPPRNTLV